MGKRVNCIHSYILRRKSTNHRHAPGTAQNAENDRSLGIVVTTQALTFDQSLCSIFLIQLLAALAELESNHASERIKAGLSAARTKGTKLGRPLDQKKRARLLKWNKAEIPVKEHARRLRKSLAAVAAMHNRMRLTE